MEDSEYEEEKAIVMIELQGVFDSDALFKEQKSFKILGLDTEEPMLQIGNCIFSGEYEDTTGTVVFFDKPEEGGGKEESPCICKTDKKLTMKRVFLEKKPEESEPSVVLDELQCQNSIPVAQDRSGSEDTIDVFPNMRSNLSPLPHQSSAQAEGTLDVSPTGSKPDVTKEQAFMKVTAQESTVIALDIEKENANLQSAETDDIITHRDEVSSLGVPNDNQLDVQANCVDLASHQEQRLSPLADPELSDVEDSNGSSDFEDLVIVSEIEGSNEASCDRCPSSLSNVVQEPVDSTDQMDVAPSERVTDSSYRHSFAISESRDVPVASGLSSPVTGILNSLVSAIHSNISCGSNSVNGQLDVVDSASHLVREYSSRLSDSSLPLICDSASSCKRIAKSICEAERHANGTLDSTARQFEESQNSVQQITTSEVIDSDSRNGSSPNEDVFENEEMDTDVDNIINTTNSMSDEVIYVTASDSELMESSGRGLTDSTTGELGFQDGHLKMGSRINSTVNETTHHGNRIADVLNNQGNEVGPSTSSSYTERPLRTSTVKDSVDSTSNQIFYRDKNYDNFKSTSGIDSTTNESGDKLLTVAVDSPKNLVVASSSEVRNGNIDSTINNCKTCSEEVDFEMREAKHTVEEIDVANVVIEFAEANHSIDSTSNEVSQLVHHSLRNVNNHRVAESAVANSVKSEENVPLCEVTESCSESINGENSFQNNSERNRASFCPDENSSSCNVTESHIDDNITTYSHQTGSSSNQIIDTYSDIGESCSNEDRDHLVSESHLPDRSDVLETTESLDVNNDVTPVSSPQGNSNLSLCEVTESCTVRKKQIAKPTVTCNQEGVASVKKSSERNMSQITESCTSSSKDSQYSAKYEQSMLDHVAKLSRQIKVPATEFCASSSKHVDSVMETEDGIHSQSAESSDQDEKQITEFNAFKISNVFSEVSESNMETEDIIVDVVTDFPIVISESGDRSIHQNSCEVDGQHVLLVSSENNENEVTASFATSSNNVHDETCDVTESDMDIEENPVNKVSESLDRRKVANESCASSSEQHADCEVTESDESVMYIVTDFSHENETEVTESCSSNANRYPVFDVTESEAEIKESIHYVVAEPSESDNTDYSEPCVSSNEQPTVTKSENVLYIVSEPDETEGRDSYPSSSKEISESNICIEEVLYVAADSPETETINDPCTSSSNKPSFVLDSISEMEIEDDTVHTVTESSGQCNAEVSESCSSSDNHHGMVNSNLGVLYIVTDPSEQNEAEVTESCTASNKQVYEVAESNEEREEGVLYIITDSPDENGAEVSESCATSSKRCESNIVSAHLLSRTSEISDQSNMEVTESCASSKESESGVEFIQQSYVTESSEQSFSHTLSCSEIDLSVYVVSDSTNVFNPPSECVSEVVELSTDMRGDDSSSCEVTESYIQDSAYFQDTAVSNDECRDDVTESYETRVVSSKQVARSPCSPTESSSSSSFQANESSTSSKTVSSTAFKEPSSSYVSVSSASDTAGWSISSVVVSSANDISGHGYSDAPIDMSVSEANVPSASENSVISHNTSSGSSENEVSDSFDQNPADSTGNYSSPSRGRRYVEQPTEGSDNSKLPSSTSN